MALILLLIACAAPLLAPLMMRLTVLPRTYSDVSRVHKTSTAVILGASVVNGEPSPVLAARADGAVALFRAGKVEQILITGDGVAQDYDEVEAVSKYLAKAEIPPERILLDTKGLDTYASIYHAVTSYGIESMTIVTQDFHLPRALFIARFLGADAYGLKADEGGSLNDYLREIPASYKALYDLLFRRSI